MRYPSKIPTIVGLTSLLLLLIGGLGAKRVVFQKRAGPKFQPQNLKITNITAHSFTVSWLTDTPTTGTVLLNFPQTSSPFFDLRDRLTKKQGRYLTHWIPVEGLQPAKQYQFFVLVDGKRFGPYQTKTASLPTTPPPKANLAFGRVETPEGQPASGAIVYLVLPGASPLSSLVSQQGNWAIPFAWAYNQNLDQLADYQDGLITEEILVEAGGGAQAKAVVYTKDDNPVPTIVLGQTFDFRRQENVHAPSPTPTPTPNTSRLQPIVEENNPPEVEFVILNPQEGETVYTKRPQIFGQAPAGSKIKITLQSNQKQEAVLEVDESQRWGWTPPASLEPGTHTLTVEYQTPQGETKTITRRFIVAVPDEQELPAFEASPSGETTTPTQTPTPTPTISPTPTIPPRQTLPSTESGVPQSGNLTPALWLLIMGGIGIILGLVF